jgi:hypothetical protein
MAHLNTLDFCSALCVCTRWYAAAQLGTSWPTYTMSDLIVGLRNEQHWWYEETSMWKRCLSPGRDTLSRVHTHTFTFMSTALASPIWKNARQISVPLTFAIQDEMSVDRNRLGTKQKTVTLLPQFSHLVALHLHLGSWHDFEQLELVWKNLQLRLEVLILSLRNPMGCAVQHLRMLARLRVLSVPAIPPADAISDMHQLEAIRVNAQTNEYNLFGFMDAIVQLSTVHRLRVVCIADANSEKLGDWFDRAIAEPAAETSRVTPHTANQSSSSALYEFIACHWRPTGSTLRGLASRFPALTRLSCTDLYGTPFKAQGTAALCKQLKFLNVTTFAIPLDAFASCDALEEAHLHIVPPSPWLWPLSWTSTLHHLTLILPRVDTYETFEAFRALHGLISLTFTNCLVSDQLHSLVQALSTLPRFARLEVGFDVDRDVGHLSYPDLVTADVWEWVARSATWTTLRLRLVSSFFISGSEAYAAIDKSKETYMPTNVTVDAKLARRLSFYVQLPDKYRNPTEICLRLVETNDTSPTTTDPSYPYMWKGTWRPL